MIKNKFVLASICLLFLSTSCLFAQNTDSLQKQLSIAKEDTNKIKTLLLICTQIGTVSDSSRKVYSEAALLLSEKLGYTKGKITSLISLAVSVSNMGKLDESLKYLNQALQISNKIANKQALAEIYGAIAGVYYSKGDYNTALTYYIKSITIYEGLNRKDRIASIEYNISLIYYQNKEFGKAAEYITKASRIFEEFKDTVMISLTVSQLGNINFDQGNNEIALKFYKQSLQFTDKLPDKSYSLVNIVGIGNTLFEMKKFSEALIYHLKALQIAKELNDDQTIAMSLMNVGHAYAYTGKFKEGVDLIKQSIDLLRKVGAKETITDAYAMLFEVFEKEKNFKEALKYSKLYIDLNDSIYNEENAQQINSLSAKYESEKKEKEIALLNLELVTKQKNQQILNTSVEEKNKIITIIIFGAIFFIIAAILFFNSRQLRQKNEYQREISKQQEHTAISIIKAQENERNRIAQDLHDGIGTFLSTLKINLQSFEGAIPPEKMAHYKNTSELVDKTAIELRNIMKNLSSETLQEYGLEGALQELTDSVNRSGMIQFTFLSHGITKRVDSIIEINLYRVAQELINNCIKHSQATQATLQLIDYENTMLLMLEDNGKGFDAQTSRKNNHYGMGLNNIRNRVNFIKGTFKTESILEKGSTFIIETPKHLS